MCGGMIMIMTYLCSVDNGQNAPNDGQYEDNNHSDYMLRSRTHHWLTVKNINLTNHYSLSTFLYL